MDNLRQVVREQMQRYARQGLNSQSHLIHSDDDAILSVITVPSGRQTSGSFVSLMVRLIGENIVIERDQNDKPLVDALVQAGVPCSQIILAYAGETMPEPT